MTSAKISLWISLAGAGALATSCMVGPNYVTPRAKLASQWAPNPALTNRPFSDAEIYWWRNFDDPVLDRLVETACSNNLSLQVAGVRVLEARARLGKSIGNLFPQQQGISGQVNYTKLNDSVLAGIPGVNPNYVSDQLLFGATWEIDFWGKYRRAIQSNRADFLGSIASYDDGMVTLISDVASAYVNIRTLEERRRVALHNLELQRESLRIATAQFNAGQTSELDEQQAATRLGQTESQIPLLDQGISQYQNGLAVLLGDTPEHIDAQLTGPGGIPVAPDRVAVGIPRDLLRRRPDVRAAGLTAASYSALIGVAKANMYPAFSLSGEFGVGANNQFNNTLSDMFMWQSRAANAGAGILFPVFNYGTIALRDKLARLPGVGDVMVFGIGQYAMRVWLDPELMRERALTPRDVIGAIQKQNVKVAAGQIGMPPAPPGQEFQLTVNVQGALTDVNEFENIIVKSDTGNGGQLTRIRDVGRVELGAQTYSQFFDVDDRPAGGIAIYQLPEANALDTAQRVRTAMEQYAKSFPPGLSYSIPFDTTKFVRASVNEVYRTLFEAGLLVLLVIMVFLQNWRATLVPATTVPVTIVGAFAGMAALGFSVNLLTLFAVVLAIGIVVDDAIVVVEGASQHIERGKTPKQASIDAMRDLFGPIIGITLVLMSVFLPPAFMPGITGQMYRQFALVIAVTALISAVNAVTLKPTQCALWLRASDPGRRKNVFYRWFNSVYQPSERFYARLIRRMVRRSGLMVLVALGLVGAAV
jgi:NodT family efflux transporter outer membrane factor (OMF) lipoprotein